MKFLYFGHSRYFYDTQTEKLAIEIIRKRFPEYKIINPNTVKHQQGCMEGWSGTPGEEIEYFLNLTKRCEIGVFLPREINNWSPGSAAELNYMRAAGKKTYIVNLQTHKCRLIKNINSTITFEQERDYLIKQGKETYV